VLTRSQHKGISLKNREFRDAVTNGARAATVVEPRCPHAGECGGCAFQDRAYDGQLTAKGTVISQLFERTISVVPSPDPYEYRTRMDYVSTKGRFGLRMRGKFNHIVDLTTCHLIPPAGLQAAKTVWERAMALGIPDYNIRTHEGLLRYVVVRRSPTNQFLLAAVTGAGGDEGLISELAATALAQPGVISFHWLVNETMTDMAFGQPHRFWGEPLLPMQVGKNTLLIGPNTFFQNNLHLLPTLLADVAQATYAAADGKPPMHIADLYGGVGLIGLHLAPQAASVVTVEAAGESAELAAKNIALNKHQNIQNIAADVLIYLQSCAIGAFDAVIVDPPRTGLGPEVCNELRRLRPRRIVYVSCNPLTLKEDLQALEQQYSTQILRGYDMFPHTPHVEMLAVLERLSL
jgi:23S rRNA (uracil-5-)-methyltransferase RumA